MTCYICTGPSAWRARGNPGKHLHLPACKTHILQHSEKIWCTYINRSGWSCAGVSVALAQSLSSRLSSPLLHPTHTHKHMQVTYARRRCLFPAGGASARARTYDYHDFHFNCFIITTSVLTRWRESFVKAQVQTHYWYFKINPWETCLNKGKCHVMSSLLIQSGLKLVKICNKC